MANHKLNINENKNSKIPNTLDIPELDEDKILLVTDTFSHVELFLQSDKKQSYARLCAPGLYSFELPKPNAMNSECVTNNEENEHLTDAWTNNDECLIELNLINESDEAQLGVLQRDEVTGEMYMLMPIEVDVLLKPDPSVTADDLFNAGLHIMANQTGGNSTTTIAGDVDNNAADNAGDAIVGVNVDANFEAASQTTLTEFSASVARNESGAQKEVEQVLSERQLCSIVVPKMCLTFDLQLDTGSLME